MDIRKHNLNLRKNISQEQRFAAATLAANQLIATDLFKHSQHIACYLAQDNEFDCMPIIKVIWQAKKNCYLPVLSTVEKHTLIFAAYEPNTKLKVNRYHIPEPDTLLHFPEKELDLVLMPLVGFDLTGHRLGMGKGYYDRTFQFLQDQQIKKPFLLGLAYEVQKLEYVPTDTWDIAMDGVLTEEQLYLV